MLLFCALPQDSLSSLIYAVASKCLPVSFNLAMSTRVGTNSLERGLAVMKTIGQRRGGMTNAELSRALEIPKSTCTYILTRLEREGFVVRHDATGRYKIGLDTLPLAHNALREAEFLAIAEPVLYQLAESTGLVAILGALAGSRVLAVDRVESPEFVHHSAAMAMSACYSCREQRGAGAEYPLNESAMGRVVLAHLAPEDRAKMLPDGRCQPELIAELEKIRDHGYALTYRQSHFDMLTIAAPIFDRQARVRACVCIMQNAFPPATPDLSGLIDEVKKAGREISKRLALVQVDGHSVRLPMPHLPETAVPASAKSNLASLLREAPRAFSTH